MSRPLIISHDRRIGELAAHDPRAATLLFQKGIDPARHGGATLAQACALARLETADVASAIAAATATPRPTGDDMAQWPLDRLVHHIVHRHHTYVRERTPLLVNFLERLSGRHGRRHPELFAMAILFKSVSADLLVHLDAEEQVLFPYIKELAQAARNRSCVLPGPFGTVRGPVRALLTDHERESQRLNLITGLTCGYALPPDADSTYVATFQLLKEFAEDLQWHVHLEANILFPRAIEMERPAAPWHPLDDEMDELR
ncbi:MAG: hemerythrin domain-containing protein [Flavobacteriales bacterium]|jgi:regulator of cell morphogenesis and NO signaling|nr:hemerythrin domain-containing protein [Flavobacteriales bacterium]